MAQYHGYLHAKKSVSIKSNTSSFLDHGEVDGFDEEDNMEDDDRTKMAAMTTNTSCLILDI